MRKRTPTPQVLDEPLPADPATEIRRPAPRRGLSYGRALSTNRKGVPWEQCVERLEEWAVELFAHDVRLFAIGVTDFREGYGLRAYSHVKMPVPLSAEAEAVPSIDGVPLTYTALEQAPHPVALPPALRGSLPPEQGQHRPLAVGLEVSNQTAHLRSGSPFLPKTGSVGAFVRTAEDEPALLTNYHVVGPFPRAGDQIAQPAPSPPNGGLVGTLSDFKAPTPTLPGSPLVFNDVDIALVACEASEWQDNEFLPERGRRPIRGIGRLAKNMRVIKVGRTTGETVGRLADFTGVLRDQPYDVGLCSFRDVFTVESIGGRAFAGAGDSGSLVFDDQGRALGLLFAKAGNHFWVCRIERALAAMRCHLR